jgi:hypothetical protein
MGGREVGGDVSSLVRVTVLVPRPSIETVANPLVLHGIGFDGLNPEGISVGKSNAGNAVVDGAVSCHDGVVVAGGSLYCVLFESLVPETSSPGVSESRFLLFPEIPAEYL